MEVELCLICADLYYRLNVIPICLPPLRERVQDIPLLVQYFGQNFSARFNKPIDLVPEDVMEVLKAHAWPGSIRGISLSAQWYFYQDRCCVSR
jgi:transcriptional regulator with PAS, ATPase and Fis domain